MATGLSRLRVFAFCCSLKMSRNARGQRGSWKASYGDRPSSVMFGAVSVQPDSRMRCTISEGPPWPLVLGLPRAMVPASPAGGPGASPGSRADEGAARSPAPSFALARSPPNPHGVRRQSVAPESSRDGQKRSHRGESR